LPVNQQIKRNKKATPVLNKLLTPEFGTQQGINYSIIEESMQVEFLQNRNFSLACKEKKDFLFVHHNFHKFI
jgi:hypothetical protein